MKPDTSGRSLAAGKTLATSQLESGTLSATAQPAAVDSAVTVIALSGGAERSQHASSETSGARTKKICVHLALEYGLLARAAASDGNLSSKSSLSEDDMGSSRDGLRLGGAAAGFSGGVDASGAASGPLEVPRDSLQKAESQSLVRSRVRYQFNAVFFTKEATQRRLSAMYARLATLDSTD